MWPNMGKNLQNLQSDTGLLKIDTGDTGVLKIDGHRKNGKKGLLKIDTGDTALC